MHSVFIKLGTQKSKEVRLVKLRNPLGFTEWTGQWSPRYDYNVNLFKFKSFIGKSIVKYMYIIITMLRNPIHSQAYYKHRDNT